MEDAEMTSKAGAPVHTGRIYPVGHRGFELFVQQVALSQSGFASDPSLSIIFISCKCALPLRLPPIFHPCTRPDASLYQTDREVTSTLTRRERCIERNGEKTRDERPWKKRIGRDDEEVGKRDGKR